MTAYRAAMVGLLVLLVATLAAAQDMGTAPAAPADTITVMATGTAEAVPDVLKIRLPVSATAPLATDAAAQTRKKVEELMAQLATAQIPADAMQRSGIALASASPGYSEEALSGFAATETITITLKGVPADQAPQRVSAVLDAASRIGALSMRHIMPGEGGLPWQAAGSMVTFATADPEALQAAALKNAVDNAQRIANGLATALGVKIARVRSVSMGTSGYPAEIYAAYGVQALQSSAPTAVTATVSAEVSFDFTR